MKTRSPFTSTRPDGAPDYDPATAGVAADLRGPTGPIEPVLARLDPAMVTPIHVSNREFRQLVDFVRNGLLDSKARPGNLRKLIPGRVPSGRPIQIFNNRRPSSA